MRIALVSDCYLPTKNGVVTSLRELAGGLRRRGHHVVIITVGGRSGLTGRREMEESGAVLYRFPLLPVLPSVEAGVGIAAGGHIGRILDREAAELLHSHTEFTLARAAVRAARRRSIPCIHTLHTTYEEYRHYLLPARMMSKRCLRSLWSGFLRRYDAVLCPSEYSLEFARSCAPEIPAELLPNGTDLTKRIKGEAAERTAVRRAFGVDPGCRVLLYCGRLAREKRSLQLLEALIPLLHARPECRLVMVGGGPEERKLARMAAGAGVRPNIVFTGYLSRENALQWYRAADLFVTASMSENHPLSLIEAQRLGLPVIARRGPGNGEIVREGRSGRLAGSDEELRMRCGELLDAPEERRRMGAEAERSSARFSSEAYAGRAEEAYRRLSTASIAV
jgi:1,2-diacylglycerol 3-alpha-glucosyltransferase